MTTPTFRDNMTVALVKASASDADVLFAARVSIQGERSLEALDADPASSEGLIGHLMRNRHGSPFEHASMTFYVQAPIFVFREFMRHRIASYNEECLSGSTVVTRLNPNGSISHRKNATLESIWNNWHVGVVDTRGRTRRLESCRNIIVRSFDEVTGAPVSSRVSNILQKGIQTTWLVETESGNEIRATSSHRFFTPAGWKTLGELSVGDYVYRAGKVSVEDSAYASPTLRSGITQWVSAYKRRLVATRGEFSCAGCGTGLTESTIEIDHRVPVSKDLSLALSETNLQTLCRECHRTKTNSEQCLSRRGSVASIRADRITSISHPTSEMTYDLVLCGPHHNYVANGLVVHNSARYRELRPVFYVPGPDRRLGQVGKPGHYEYVEGSHEQYDLVVAETKRICTDAYGSYTRMLAAGVAREVARIVLPLTIYSSMYVTMNARALMNFLSLRTKDPASTYPSYPQREIEMCAEAMETEWAKLMPVTHAAFCANGRVAP